MVKKTIRYKSGFTWSNQAKWWFQVHNEVQLALFGIVQKIMPNSRTHSDQQDDWMQLWPHLSVLLSRLCPTQEHIVIKKTIRCNGGLTWSNQAQWWPQVQLSPQRFSLTKRRSHEVATCRRCNSLRCTVLDRICTFINHICAWTYHRLSHFFNYAVIHCLLRVAKKLLPGPATGFARFFTRKSVCC